MVNINKKHKKLKIKKLNLIILILSFILGTIIIYKTSTYVITLINSKSKSLEQIEQEQKLKKLNNIDQKINYFNYNNIDRYLEYKKENKNLSLKKIIMEVNIGLDNPHYYNSKETTYLNKEYILVNKYHHLSENYIPKNLNEIDLKYALNNMKLVNYAKDAFEKMSEDASKENLKIIAMSTYRDYTYQKNLYNKYVSIDGIDLADTYSARPGHSEHQTGLAVDVYNGTDDYNNFENTKEYEWMQKNAHKYGFILRYPKDKEKETSYQYESWHYRYVGEKIATYIKKHNISFEEYYVQFIEK